MNFYDELRNTKLFGKKKENKKTFISSMSGKKKAEMNEKKKNPDTRQDDWFEERRKEMTGVCIFCSGKTEKDNDNEYRRSIAHLFPKRRTMFPSIATHPMNCLELCFYGESHHTNFDNANRKIDFKAIKKKYPDAWEVIVDKTRILYSAMTSEERTRVPNILLEAIGEK